MSAMFSPQPGSLRRYAPYHGSSASTSSSSAMPLTPARASHQIPAPDEISMNPHPHNYHCQHTYHRDRNELVSQHFTLSLSQT